jgi:hypothetical protein
LNCQTPNCGKQLQRWPENTLTVAATFELGATPEEDAGSEEWKAEKPFSMVAEGLLPAIMSGRQDGY